MPLIAKWEDLVKFLASAPLTWEVTFVRSYEAPSKFGNGSKPARILHFSSTLSQGLWAQSSTELLLSPSPNLPKFKLGQLVKFQRLDTYFRHASLMGHYACLHSSNMCLCSGLVSAACFSV